jgi:nucleoside 2-deoxyribosyltransferase
MTRFYFCGSIRGGRELASLYASVIALLKSHGSVLTEHLGSDREIERKDRILSDQEIHDRDMQWILESDLVVAEVTVPSLGVGYEVGRALHLGKPVCCLFNPDGGYALSAMIAGCSDLEIISYRSWDGLKSGLQHWVRHHTDKLEP